MAKQATTEEMKTLESRLNQQDELLKEILICIKGSDSLGIEGVIPAQKRMEKKMSEEIEEIKEWKKELQVYLGLFTSTRMWKALGLIVMFIGVCISGFKIGWQKLVQLFIDIFN